MSFTRAPILGEMRRNSIPKMQTFKRFAFLSAVGLTVLLGPFLFGYHFNTLREASISLLNDPKQTIQQLTTGSISSSSSVSSASIISKGFHLLLPATDPNVNVCKLLLTIGILGYPEPVFIGWHGRGVYNGAESHLFKITETLTYLRGLDASQDDDMVLILDAYDIWLQLRPDVLIKRYHSVVSKNNERLRRDGILGRTWGGAEVRSSIIFGPDKIHWPQFSPSPCVWAVPESPLDRWAFGLDTDVDMFNSRPRWLNSGTIMGPAKEMRDLFAATLDMLSKMYDADWEFRTSDQFYFAEVWGEQEVNRRRLRDGDKFEVPKGAHLPKTGWSNPGSHVRTEFGITLDYESDLFQTAAAYDRHLLWMRFNGSQTSTSAFEEELRDERGYDNRGKTMDKWTIGKDVRESDPPFNSVTGEVARQKDWEDLLLGTNVITEQVFPLFHVTGDKSLRERWWPRMWFHPHSEMLLKAAKRKRASQQDPSVLLTQDNVRWKVVRTDGLDTQVPIGDDQKGGAWTDGGDYLRWPDMCQEHEDEVYLRQ